MSSGWTGTLARMANQPPPVGPPDPAQPYPPGPGPTYQAYPPHPGQPHVHYVPVVAPTSGAAVVALVFGIVGLFLSWCSLCIPSLVAVVCGHVGVVATRQGRRSGRGMAVAGLVLGYLVVALTVLVVAVAPEAVANGLRMFGDFGAALADFFGNLVGFVGGPLA